MSTRFGLVQAASIAGTALGGVITAGFGQLGPFVAYGVIGVGLVLLALYALAIGRSSTSPLIGAPYEQAQVNGSLSTSRSTDLVRPG
jgi:hypothetical protein